MCIYVNSIVFCFTVSVPYNLLYSSLHIGRVPYIPHAGSSTQRLHQQLCVLVEDKPLGEILARVPEGGQCEEMYRRYLYDFVRSVHKCTHKQKETVDHEYKVCLYVLRKHR